MGDPRESIGRIFVAYANLSLEDDLSGLADLLPLVKERFEFPTREFLNLRNCVGLPQSYDDEIGLIVKKAIELSILDNSMIFNQKPDELTFQATPKPLMDSLQRDFLGDRRDFSYLCRLHCYQYDGRDTCLSDYFNREPTGLRCYQCDHLLFRHCLSKILAEGRLIDNFCTDQIAYTARKALTPEIRLMEGKDTSGSIWGLDRVITWDPDQDIPDRGLLYLLGFVAASYDLVEFLLEDTKGMAGQCPHCGLFFIKSRSNQIFCRPKCRQNYHNHRNIASGKHRDAMRAYRAERPLDYD